MGPVPDLSGSCEDAGKLAPPVRRRRRKCRRLGHRRVWRGKRPLVAPISGASSPGATDAAVDELVTKASSLTPTTGSSPPGSRRFARTRSSRHSPSRASNGFASDGRGRGVVIALPHVGSWSTRPLARQQLSHDHRGRAAGAARVFDGSPRSGPRSVSPSCRRPALRAAADTLRAAGSSASWQTGPRGNELPWSSSAGDDPSWRPCLLACDRERRS